jgi:hypothetical protein
MREGRSLVIGVLVTAISVGCIRSWLEARYLIQGMFALGADLSRIKIGVPT